MAATASGLKTKRVPINQEEEEDEENPNYTKGEKCIFCHLFVTLFLVLIVVTIYIVHVSVINHIGSDYYKITRRAATGQKSSVYQSIGMVYLNLTSPKMMCCSLLLKQQWSVVTAHCVTVRSNPELSNLLPKWKIKYNTIDDDEMESEIKRGIVHSYFDSDDFSNNIGLFEHKENIYSTEFIVYNNLLMRPIDTGPTTSQTISTTKNEITNTDFVTDNSLLKKHGKSMKLANWRDRSQRSIIQVRPLSVEKCSRIVSSMAIDLRTNEFCVMKNTQKDVELDNGAVLMINEHIIGFFSWGDRECKGLPFVILNIYPFKNWLDFIISL